jgi:hypothetical protein
MREARLRLLQELRDAIRRTGVTDRERSSWVIGGDEGVEEMASDRGVSSGLREHRSLDQIVVPGRDGSG